LRETSEVVSSASPRSGPKFQKRNAENSNRANISQLFLSASSFLHLLFLLLLLLITKRSKSFFWQCRKHALTKIFVLSNIRFVSGGSSEMLRTSRCFGSNFPNSSGLGRFQRLRPLPIVFLAYPRKYSRAVDSRLQFLSLNLYWDVSLIAAGPSPEGNGRRFRDRQIIFEDHESRR